MELEAQWLASMRPPPDDLITGAAFVGSKELKAHACYELEAHATVDGSHDMLRAVGELSASRMLGKKAGAHPGTDAATDAAWTYLADKPDWVSRITAGAVAAAPPYRKDYVRQFLTWLLSPLGLRYLRAFARELRRATTASLHAAVTDVVTDAARVNWSACWAWCVQHSTTLTGWTTEFSRRTSAHCVAGTVTSWRRPSARCSWLGIHFSAL